MQVDKHIRRLDADLKKFEAELEQGSVNITFPPFSVFVLVLIIIPVFFFVCANKQLEHKKTKGSATVGAASKTPTKAGKQRESAKSHRKAYCFSSYNFCLLISFSFSFSLLLFRSRVLDSTQSLQSLIPRLIQQTTIILLSLSLSLCVCVCVCVCCCFEQTMIRCIYCCGSQRYFFLK